MEHENTKVTCLTEEASNLRESVENKIKENSENKNEIKKLHQNIKVGCKLNIGLYKMHSQVPV